MSDVYLAINRSKQIKVALKIINSERNREKEQINRIDREISIMKRLNFPGIIKIYDSGIFNNRYFIAMEYLKNGDLLKNVLTNFKLDYIINIFIKILNAITFMHTNGIIHRDLKPSNILFRDNNTPFITDFGTSKIQDREDISLTKSDMVIGTLAYMPPEQKFNIKSVDKRSDIYSLGAIFYHILTGHLPVGRFKDPKMIIRDFPDEIESIILKSMSEDKELRYSNTAPLKEDLMKILGNPPLLRHFNELAPIILKNHKRESVPEDDITIESRTEFSKLYNALESDSITGQRWAEDKLKENIKEYSNDILEVLKKGESQKLFTFIEIAGYSNNKDIISILQKYLRIPKYHAVSAVSLLRHNIPEAFEHIFDIARNNTAFTNRIIDAVIESNNAKSMAILFELYMIKPFLHIRRRILESIGDLKDSNKIIILKKMLHLEKNRELKNIIDNMISRENNRIILQDQD